MAESAVANNSNAGTRYAVVTGANKGIGYGICKQLAANGIVVVLTARDEKRGIDALEKLKKENGYSSENVLFHKLDVSDSSSVESLAKFIDSQFGKLDILVNNAGIGGIRVDVVAFDSIASQSAGPEAAVPNLWKHATQDYESAIEGIQINYYGAKRMISFDSKSSQSVGVSIFFSFIHSSFIRNCISRRQSQLFGYKVLANDTCFAGKGSYEKFYCRESLIRNYIRIQPKHDRQAIPFIYNVFDVMCHVPDGRIKETLTDDTNNLTSEKLDEVIDEFLKDVKEDTLKDKGWIAFLPAYTISKAAMNVYTRILAKNYSNIKLYAVCHGFVKTNINYNTGVLGVEEGTVSPVKLALLPDDDGPSGLFIFHGEVSNL